MLNRRILRIKAFKIIYSYAVTRSMSLEDAYYELEVMCEATRDLYLYMMSIVSPLTKMARQRMEAARNKFNPTQEELNPNEKFVNNALAKLLDSDPDFMKLIEKKKYSWEQYDILLRKVLDSVYQKEYFRKYMESKESSLKEDCKLFVSIFENEFNELPELDSILEDKSIFWTDDLPYSLTWCCKSCEEIARKGIWRLPELYQSEVLNKSKPGSVLSSDRVFARTLLKNAFTSYEKYFEMINEAVPDWDKERIFSMDIAIIVLGMAEAVSFPDIPLKVTLNEYIEISKFYSSPKSRVFVNGLLNKMLKENNTLNKQL